MDSTQDFQPRTFSIKLWPPSESTRLLLVERMTKNLSTESIFSRKYGLLGKQEAHENAKRIEELCFASADEHFKREPDGDGSSAVQLYAKETSKMMLEVLKKGPRTTAELETPVADTPLVPADTVLDISGGKRVFIEADEAKELLSPLTKPGNSYKRICFSNRSFGIGAANVAGSILESVKNQLTEVDISDFVAERPEDEALDVMRIFSKALEGYVLRYLNISDNALGEKGVRAFSELLKSQESLEELYVMNDGISEEAAKALSELIPATEKLKVLHFHNNMTGDEGLALSKTLPKLPDLVELYLSDLNLENKGTKAIANALKQSAPQLEVLEMAGNEINAKAAPDLAKCLAAMQSLKKLTLAENELKDDGAVIIAKSLEDGHTDLNELDVSTNMMQRVGARCFARAVANKPAFVQLNINGNFISDEGIDEVKEILKAGKKSLDVLGSLDENEPDGEPDDEEEDEDAEDNEDELDSKLQSVKVEQDD
ncbi:unnamed protein product [Miscanthus lutarioriparius]|uniref:WPP domain-containing protein n=1 Tax=Miscanthus lutarioriparius TaxID=422564 RepID=A0A811PKL5_9POAL|nr:unnamed protein product [Miscanthus lutarioriparius]